MNFNHVLYYGSLAFDFVFLLQFEFYLMKLGHKIIKAKTTKGVMMKLKKKRLKGNKKKRYEQGSTIINFKSFSVLDNASFFARVMLRVESRKKLNLKKKFIL
jgi:hypothetical protein